MLIKNAQIGNEILEIHTDEDPIDPRGDDNLGIIVCWHKRYVLGDKHEFQTPSDFELWLKENKAVVLPIYMYDHSGISLSTNNGYPFNDRWDAGQVGFIYVTYETLKDEYSVKRVTGKLVSKARTMLENEISTYNQFLSGEVYGFNLYTTENCKCCGHEIKTDKDSCWGFYSIDDILNELDEKWKKVEWKEP